MEKFFEKLLKALLISGIFWTGKRRNSGNIRDGVSDPPFLLNLSEGKGI
jgi:hypothetical protein